jgi:outer membrane lipoprotein SlyB
MRHLILTLGALSLAVPATIILPASHASAQQTVRHGKTVRKVCRKSSGTTGLVGGAVGGAVVGSAVGGGVLGTVAGGVGGAFAGRAIDRSITAKKRCRYVTVR